jgi:Lon-like protease
MHAITRNPATIVPDAEVHPAEVPIATYHAIEKSAYVDGGQIAAGVAERALGDQVTITADGLTVAAVEAGSPASHALHAGDRITAVDGTPAESGDDLAAAVQRSSGKALSLTVDAAGSTSRTVSITPVASGSDGRLVIGVAVDPANVEVHLQVPVTIDASGVEGPSAGLMTALTVYDELSPVDLAGGRRIAGTGTLDTGGNVGVIGGIQAKARAAAAAGAELFLAPASQAADARAVLGTRIPVIGVTTFQQALSALSASAPALRTP